MVCLKMRILQMAISIGTMMIHKNMGSDYPFHKLPDPVVTFVYIYIMIMIIKTIIDK